MLNKVVLRVLEHTLPSDKSDGTASSLQAPPDGCDFSTAGEPASGKSIFWTSAIVSMYWTNVESLPLKSILWNLSIFVGSVQCSLFPVKRDTFNVGAYWLVIEHWFSILIWPCKMVGFYPNCWWVTESRGFTAQVSVGVSTNVLRACIYLFICFYLCRSFILKGFLSDFSICFCLWCLC